MPNSFPAEFRADVIAVARKGEAPLRQIAKDFGISDELRLAIVTWIERTYHRCRRQRALGRLTPTEFELFHTPVATAA